MEISKMRQVNGALKPWENFKQSNMQATGILEEGKTEFIQN